MRLLASGMTYYWLQALLAILRTPAAPPCRACGTGAVTWQPCGLHQGGTACHHFQYAKRPPQTGWPFCVLKPGDDLLSHGETPHYHRRCTVSLLSSRWDQVVQVLYGRQANLDVKQPPSLQQQAAIQQIKKQTSYL